MMIALAYFSVSYSDLEESMLDEIWRAAALNNKTKKITGVLLYKSETFLQVLEGPEDVVEALYTKLNLDSRHTGLTQIYKVPITKRQYPEWSMAFKNLEKLSDTGPRGDFRNLFFPGVTAPELPDHLHKMLAFFVNEFVND